MTCPVCQASNREDAEACFTCGRALHALTLGTVLADRYEILLPLGQGGMGTVYKARDRVLEEDVAIKVLRPDVARDPVLARRFRSEIKLARRVTHRNVCRIHEYGEDGPRRYISMQYIDGVDLRTILQSTSLERTEAFGLSLQVTLGLHAVHEIGIIHRDLKSSNVMIDAKGVARLLDFGIAKEAGAETTGFTVAGKLFGTPEYMSPEHARGSEVDFRSDIYSLGCLIYEIFTRRVPFHGENAAATIVKHLQEPPAFGSLIPDSLVPVLRRALAKEPADRYADAEQLIQALDQARRAQETSRDQDDQSLTRPIGDKEQAAAWGQSTYGSVWRQTTAGRMVPVAPPPQAPFLTRSVAALQRWSPSGPRALRWAIPVVLMATAALASRQVLSPPVRHGASSVPLPSAASGSAAPSRSPSLPDPATLFASSPAPLPARPSLESAAGRTLSLAPARPATSLPPVSASPRSEPRPLVSASPPSPATSSSPHAPPPPSTLVAAASPAPEASPPALPSEGTALATDPPVASVPASPAGGAPQGPTGGTGVLKLVVVPESPVTVDDEAIGVVSTRELPLSPGPHVVRVLHPDYEPLQRKVTVREGSTSALVLDLSEKGIRRPR